MNNLQIFVYSGEQLRTVQRDDGLWWVVGAAGCLPGVEYRECNRHQKAARPG